MLGGDEVQDSHSNAYRGKFSLFKPAEEDTALIVSSLEDFMASLIERSINWRHAWSENEYHDRSKLWRATVDSVIEKVKD